MSELALADAIDQLRRELGRAIEAARGERLQFALGTVELELQVELSTKGSAKADAKWLVVSVGASAGVERTGIHTVKLTLKPQFDGKKDVNVSDTRPERD
jgi:hypothetical protein